MKSIFKQLLVLKNNTTAADNLIFIRMNAKSLFKLFLKGICLVFLQLFSD